MGPICVRRDSVAVRNHEKPVRQNHQVHEAEEERTEKNREEHRRTMKSSSNLQKYMISRYCWKHNSDSLWWCHFWDEITETGWHLWHLPGTLPEGSLILHATVCILLQWEVAAQSLHPIAPPHACQGCVSHARDVLFMASGSRVNDSQNCSKNRNEGPQGWNRQMGKSGRKNSEHLAVGLHLSWEVCYL